MTVTLKALRYFVRAVEERSIAAAAADLSVAASAVGVAIDSVERAMDLTLVHRRRAKGLEPTAAGLAVAARARALIEDHETLLSFGAELRGSLGGVLRVGYYAPIAPAFLPPVVAPLLRDNPALRVDLVACDTDAAREGLHRGVFDVILFVMDAAHPGIETVPLIDAAPYALVSADDALAGRESATVAAVCERPLVMLDLPVVRGYYDRLFEGAGAAPRIVATAATHEMVRSLVGAGVGRAILNMTPLTDRTYAGGRVVAVPLDTEARPLTLALGVCRGAAEAARGCLRQCLRRVLRGGCGAGVGDRARAAGCVIAGIARR